MVDNNIKPSNVTFSILIKIYSDQYKLDEALKIFERVKELNARPSIILYTCII